MKTTLEIEGFVIVITHDETTATVTATKDDEVVEEFTLDLREEEEGSEGAEGEDGIKDFSAFGGEEEDDFEGEEGEEGGDDEPGDDDDDEEGKVQLESFQSFLARKNVKKKK